MAKVRLAVTNQTAQSSRIDVSGTDPCRAGQMCGWCCRCWQDAGGEPAGQRDFTRRASSGHDKGLGGLVVSVEYGKKWVDVDVDVEVGVVVK